MTLYEELYYQLSDLPKFYRYEGPGSYVHFSFSKNRILANRNLYVYFSTNMKHHFYYTEKRLKQMIDKEMFYELKYSLSKKNVMNTEKFQEIIKKIENSPIEEKPMSIEFVLSPLIKQLLVNNYVRNSRKEHGTYFIERVDNRRYGGGYGFFGDWLNIFHEFIYCTLIRKLQKRI